MARGSVNVFEQHVEKITLGLAAVFLLLMVYRYLMRSPNRVEYGGQKVTPTVLAEDIKGDTEALQKAMQKAPAVDTDVPDYSAQLEEQHSACLFAPAAEGEPLVPRELPLAADFGRPVPNLSEEQEIGQSDIVLVPPLPPSAPVSRTGRDLVIRERPRLTQRSENEAEPDIEPVELPWISVAAYFDTAAEQNAMTNAGYATYLSKVYVAGVDVQRQDLLADGRYSEWQDVKRSMATPQVDIPTLEFDGASNTIVNRDALNQAFATVKAHQQQICQPQFYRIKAGDEWKMPPLDGYADVDAAEPKVKKKHTKADDSSGGPPTIHRGADEDERKAGRDKAEQALKQAEDAYRSSQDDQAARYAKEVLHNPFAPRRVRNKARAILQSVQLLQKQSGPAQQTARGPESRPGPARDEAAALITHPDDHSKLAVWYHDDTVQSGKTYRYRMRVKLWNRYVTKFTALKDPEQGKQVVLAGDWSLPSEPITVDPAAYFFLTSTPLGKGTATITVYKWHKGARVKQTFSVGVGDLIGHVQESDTGILDRQTLQPTRESVDYSTGALVLDLRFEQPVVQRSISDRGKGEFTLRENTSAVLVYLDPADGQVKQRVERFDRYDPTLRALREAEE